MEYAFSYGSASTGSFQSDSTLNELASSLTLQDITSQESSSSQADTKRGRQSKKQKSKDPSPNLQHAILQDRLQELVEDNARIANLTLDRDRFSDNQVFDFQGYLYVAMTNKGARYWMFHTNFNQEEVCSLYQQMLPTIVKLGSRGPKPKLSMLDHLILLLIVYKTGMTYAILAPAMDVAAPTLQAAVERIRGIVNHFLKSRWSDAASPRPTGLSILDCADIGLITDVMSCEVFRPRGRFEEAKIYFDGKNQIYALKKEVSVLASEPHYAVFMQKGRIGSMHDYAIFKETYPSYLEYLKKTREELDIFGTEESSWAMLFDSAYQGAPDQTSGIRRIFIQPDARDARTRMKNQELSRARVNVECFFGRLTNLWGMFKKVYRYDHSHFDADYDNCAMLTNEHIRFTQLAAKDRDFYLRYLHDRLETSEEREAKRQAAREQYASRKKPRSG